MDKATRIDLFSMRSAPMRAFHLTWMAFFVCFFAWFACAPLMPLIKREYGLDADQIANINIAAVAVTILVRLVVGPMCDRFGPRKVYSALLFAGAFPVIGAALSTGYDSFLWCRLAIGAVGASFVITQYHTSVMFAPNVVGTANATTAGWGNAGAGAAQAIVPLIVAAAIALGAGDASAWRIALLVPGIAMPVMALFYWRFTQDCPQGDFAQLVSRWHRNRWRQEGRLAELRHRMRELSRVDALRDLWRVLRRRSVHSQHRGRVLRRPLQPHARRSGHGGRQLRSARALRTRARRLSLR